MSTLEHLLTVVEPTTGGDGALAIADDTVATGGTARVVIVITDQVQRDIRNFADSEDLGWDEAETEALSQFRAFYTDRTGATPLVLNQMGKLDHQLRNQVTPDVTAIALPERLLSHFSVQDFTNSTGIPVIVTPTRAT